MGLTIHYRLFAADIGADEARKLVERLRSRASDLGLGKVEGIAEFEGNNCDIEQGSVDDFAWLKIQTILYLTPNRQQPDVGAEVVPNHIIAFTIYPGEGSEAINFGLCRYPSAVMVNGKSVSTGLHGWSWSSFTKTQYASNPTAGGIKNFLSVHLGLIQLLDYAKKLGVLAEVKDEGKYWENRDVAALIKEVGEWNAMIAAAYCEMRDAIEAAGGDPDSINAAIKHYADFEHLEAKGRRRRGNRG